MFPFTSDVAIKHVTLPILSAIMVLGNGVLIYVMLKHKTLRTVTNYLVMSLALSDGLLGGIIIPLLVAAEGGALGSSPEVCLIVYCLGISQVLASCLTLMAIALERHFAIVQPLKHHAWMTTRTAIIIIACCWIYSLIIGSLPLLGWNALPQGLLLSSRFLEYDTNFTSNVTTCQHGERCTTYAADRTTPLPYHNASLHRFSHQDCRYQYVIRGSYAAFMYPGHFVPLWIIMFILYGQIYLRSRNQNNKHRRLSISGKPQRQASGRSKENWRALRILTVLVGYFLFSWLPVVLWYCVLYKGFTIEFASKSDPLLPYWVYNTGITLAFGNGAVNPFLYGLGNRSVRKAFLKSFCCQWLKKKSTVRRGSERQTLYKEGTPLTNDNKVSKLDTSVHTTIITNSSNSHQVTAL